MGCSLCPHIVQEYFERVSDILTTYRPQILKQVEYDKISENLVIRGAIRPEEHERIYQCEDKEGRVSQMLVVVQNRMWGLENMIAVFMEEHVNPWLTQEMFRAYSEHLVTPLKEKRDNRICQCVRISNSVLYKGWVQALKSLDTWILKTGQVLGFVNQTIYPTADNMLAFLSDKLADYTGGDSSSNRDDLVPFGFAPNSSGEVQVAELEEDDINDLISLSETLCIGYPSTLDGDDKDHDYEQQSKPNSDANGDAASLHATPGKISKEGEDAAPPENSVQQPVIAKPVERKMTTGSGARKISEGRLPMHRKTRPRRSSLETPSLPSSADSNTEKQKQRDLIARLSIPKSTKTTSQGQSATTPTPSKGSVVRLPSVPSDGKGSKQRPKSMEFHRSFSLHSPSSSSPVTTSASSSTSSTSTSIPTSSQNTSRSKVKVEKSTPVTGKTTGFVRPKASLPTSPKVKSKVTPNARPTAVTKPTMKSGQGKVRQTTDDSEKIGKPVEPVPATEEEKTDIAAIPSSTPSSEPEPEQGTALFDDAPEDEDDFPEYSPEMSSLFLSKTILSKEEQTRSLGYYHLNFDDYQDN